MLITQSMEQNNLLTLFSTKGIINVISHMTDGSGNKPHEV